MLATVLRDRENVLVTLTTLRDEFCEYPHFTDEETEAL